MIAQLKPLRVLIADDHALLLHGIRRVIGDAPDLEVVAEATNGREAVRLAAEHQPDVVVIDVNMPGCDGIEATRRIRTLSPETAILVHSVAACEALVYGAIDAGALGYVVKGQDPGELGRAIRAVVRGERYLSPAVADLITQRQRDGRMVRASELLTKRERDVCRRLALGHTVPEIGLMLGISRKTVDVHKTRLMKKLNVHNRAQLVRFALRNGLVDR